MKKIFAVAILIVAILSNVCFASARVDFTLGGLTLNMSYDYVIQTYGEPTKKLNGYSQMVSKVINYGEDVEIGFLGDKIRYVVTTADNGWKTFSGVYVGMNIEEVIGIYGEDFTTQERTFNDIPLYISKSNENFFEYSWTGTKYSWSEVSYNYSYNPGDTSYILSVVVNDGKVTAIELRKSTPEF